MKQIGIETIKIERKLYTKDNSHSHFSVIDKVKTTIKQDGRKVFKKVQKGRFTNLQPLIKMVCIENSQKQNNKTLNQLEERQKELDTELLALKGLIEIEETLNKSKFNIMKIEVIHYENSEHPNVVYKTERCYKLFGIVVLRKIIHYPKSKQANVVLNF